LGFLSLLQTEGEIVNKKKIKPTKPEPAYAIYTKLLPQERLWEKLAFVKDTLELDNVDPKKSNMVTVFTSQNTLIVSEIILAVQKEFKCKINDSDLGWAILQLIRTDIATYNGEKTKALAEVGMAMYIDLHPEIKDRKVKELTQKVKLLRANP